MPEENKNLGEGMPGSKSPEDIFAEVEPEKKTEKVSLAEVSPRSASADNQPIALKKKNGKLWLVILVVILVVGSVGYFSRFFLVNLIKKGLASLENLSEEKGLGEEQKNKILEESEKNPMDDLLDSDQDGLSDEEEKRLGTDPYNLDTDGDGLSDKEEVKIYQTNPLGFDTDGDSLSDGQEVKQGSDPKNPNPGAKLMDLQKAIEELKQE